MAMAFRMLAHQARARARHRSTTNSYINLGKFETMGADVGRAATGIAYLQESVQLQEMQYQSEENAIRKSGIGMGLAKNLHEARGKRRSEKLGSAKVGRQNHQLGDTAQAIALYERALGLLDEAVGTRDSERASKALIYARFLKSEVCSSLGVAFNDAGQPEEALAQHQEALQLRKDIVGKNHSSVAECLNNLGNIYYHRGSFQKAAEHFEQALELLSESLRTDTPFVALTLYNLGLCRANLGQLPAAEAALKKALQIAERTMPSSQQADLIRNTLRGPVLAHARPD
ncbi:unnamed protein product [Effrenium voratum]|uniref:Kinesin light chain n=1 Tax=Effrenium voratum TaxID=2562239 RepID=A0AA36MTB3_9DINO|nr:unnamed protein product [Effrenium voratum]CAJ1445403.1 unnamed protein product [Effrenium voratum]